MQLGLELGLEKETGIEVPCIRHDLALVILSSFSAALNSMSGKNDRVAARVVQGLLAVLNHHLFYCRCCNWGAPELMTL